MITGIRISPSDLIVQKDGKTPFDISRLKTGQIFSAKVLRNLPGGKALMQIAGQSVPVRTELILTPGEQIRLAVTRKEDEVILKLVPHESKIPHGRPPSLVRLFSNTQTPVALSKSPAQPLSSLLEGLSLNSAKPDYDLVPRLIEKGGLLFENTLAKLAEKPIAGQQLKSVLNQLLQQDLKGSLLSQLASSGKESDIQTRVTAILDRLENFQHLNIQTSDTGRLLLPIPVLSDAAFWFGQLLIDTGQAGNQNDKDKDRILTVSFLLEMSNLGPVRADFSILKKSITGTFMLQDNDTCEFVKSMLPTLAKQLSEVGFLVRHIECIKAEADQFEPNVLVESILVDQGNKMLNIVV